MPVIARALGLDRFGVLLIMWAILGYFSLFEFGVARALIKLFAADLAVASSEGSLCRLFWTASSLLIALGALAGALFAVCTPVLVDRGFQLSPALGSEVREAFRLIALVVPVLSLTTGVRGVLEVYQRYDLVAVVRVLTGLATFVVPLAVVPLSHSVVVLALVLVVARAALLVITLLLALRTAPYLSHVSVALAPLKALLALGGWMSISTGVGLLLTYLDRFVIGATLDMTAVSYFATPYDLVTRLWIFPVAVTSVLYPALSATLRTDRGRAGMLFQRSTALVILVLVPAAIAVIAVSRPFLILWMGREFADQSSTVLQLLAVGVLANGLFRAATGLVYADGRSGFVAALQVAELPLYLVVLPIVLERYGVAGAAAVWTLRGVAEAIILFAYIEWKVLRRALSREYTAVLAGCCLMFITLAAPDSLPRISAGGLSIVVFGFYSWHRLLSGDDRSWIRRRLVIFSRDRT